VEGVLKGKVEAIEFSQPVKLAAHETQVVRFTPEKFAQLKNGQSTALVAGAVGAAELYLLDLEFVVDGQVSDSSHYPALASVKSPPRWMRPNTGSSDQR